MPFFLLLIFLFISINICSAQTTSFSSDKKSLVTAIQYCDFLNQNAASDPDHLFEQKISTDPEAACIARVGTPGQWRYEVIAGKENFPVTYVSSCKEIFYFSWLQERLQATGYSLQEEVAAYGNGDPCLKSNRTTFEIIDSQSSQMLSLENEITAGEGEEALARIFHTH